MIVRLMKRIFVAIVALTVVYAVGFVYLMIQAEQVRQNMTTP